VALGSFLILVLTVLAWNVAAFAIESSGLELGSGSIGLAAVSFIATIIWGGLPLFLSMVAALVAAFAAPRMARAAAWVIAALAAVCGAGLFLVAALTIRGVQAEQAFAAASIVLGLVLLVPLALCARGARSRAV
jgi:hypothetical protein